MKIAVIGAGISGLVCAYRLHRDHEVTVYESGNYAGGHAHTVTVERQGRSHAVDTGFIVFNQVTYPNFCRLLEQLGVASRPTMMTFSLKCEKTGLEYNIRNLNTLFAQRHNLFVASFYRMVWDIFRFRREFDCILLQGEEEAAIGPYLRRYSAHFIEQFIVPLGASLWSAAPAAFDQFPLGTFVRFFQNHGFISIRNPIQWRTISGGSARYVERLTAPFQDRLRLNCPVRRVHRRPDRVVIETAAGQSETHDQVILAVHSDQALALLAEPTTAEKEVLGAIPYQENLTILHTDSRLLPRKRSIWASWNYLIPRRELGRAALTYDMNILQGLEAAEEFLVTLNQPEAVAADQELGRYLYHHPVYTNRAPGAQARHAVISGTGRTHFCGAYWGYGFHEDGVNSALKVCRYFGKGG